MSGWTPFRRGNAAGSGSRGTGAITGGTPGKPKVLGIHYLGCPALLNPRCYRCTCPEKRRENDNKEPI